jgi:hypothetical protein
MSLCLTRNNEFFNDSSFSLAGKEADAAFNAWQPGSSETSSSYNCCLKPTSCHSKGLQSALARAASMTEDPEKRFGGMLQTLAVVQPEKR